MINIEEFNSKLIDLAKQINIEISTEQAEKFYKYMKLLLDWNEKINLTAITDADDIILKHFIDSITIIKYIDGTEKIIDVGTGAGFPGIPIAIIMPNSKITLLDSLNKRILFLNEVIKELDLKNIETIHSRAEDAGKNIKFREQFDIAVSRAVANLSTLSEYLMPFVKLKGKMICMKGSNIEEETNNAKFAIKKLGGKIVLIDEFCLPNAEIKRNVVIVEKENNTLKIYPRKAGLPSKEPLNNK